MCNKRYFFFFFLFTLASTRRRRDDDDDFIYVHHTHFFPFCVLCDPFYSFYLVFFFYHGQISAVPLIRCDLSLSLLHVFFSYTPNHIPTFKHNALYRHRHDARAHIIPSAFNVTRVPQAN